MREKSKFAFAIYDMDRDSLISSRDLHDFLKDLPESSSLAQEIKKISNDYLDNTIFTRHKKKPGFFDFDYFFAVNPRSVLIDVRQSFAMLLLLGIRTGASWGRAL